MIEEDKAINDFYEKGEKRGIQKKGMQEYKRYFKNCIGTNLAIFLHCVLLRKK